MAESKGVTGAEITGGTDGHSMEAVAEPRATMDVEDPERVCEASSRPSEHGEKENLVAAEQEEESKETQHEEPEIKETFSTCLIGGCEPGSTSDSEKEERFEVKIEEEFESKKERVAIKDDCSEDSPAGPDGREDTDMQEITSEELANTEMDTTESINVELQQEADGGMFRVYTANDLDEMMDIGTVDQVEQEAQMKEEQQTNEMVMDDGRSPSYVNKASMTETRNSVEERADVKPAVWLPPAEKELLSGDMNEALDTVQSGSSPSSEATATSGRDSASPAATVNGMKVVQLSIPRLEIKSVQGFKSSPSPPLVKVKDEPVDDEYEHALIPSAFAADVKDEPNTTKEDLRIGSVFSVPPAGETQRLPIFYPSSAYMSCSSCKKNLMKGQTAFQRKGSPALFCSTTCLSKSVPATKGVTKICHSCQKFIIRPQDIILVPDAKGTVREFCSQICLTSFNYKHNISNFRISAAIKTTPKPISPQSLCSMCTKYCISKHEVILSGSVHKICSDACFNRFRAVNKLSMAGCANCGSYSHSRPLMLKMEDCNKTLCNAECLAKYKENTKITKPCTMCRTSGLLEEMVDNKNSDDSVNLFCSSSCVMAFKVQTVSTSGARLNCDSCEKTSVPAYHLAMSDTSIRNFCTLPCVMAFQEKFKKSQKQVNVFTKLPVGAPQIQTGTPIQTLQDVPKGPLKLNCSQCDRNISFKPELLQIKDKLVFFCGGDCAHEYKKDKFVTSLCEYCKIEKITSDAKRVNNRDCFFCSDGCKLLFRHEMTKKWGKHCHSCVYCHGMSKKLVTAQYGGSTEEFCSEECRSKYTMLFCHVAKCDTCGLKGKLKQSLPILGGVKHFCNLSCLLHFCCNTVAAQGDVVIGSAGPEEATPVIANVVSLAGPQTQKSSACKRAAQQQHTNTGTVFQSKNSGHSGTQTDAVSGHLPKILKNKAVLCRPLVQNKGVTCKTQTADVEAQTDDVYPQIMVVPVPVPVYVPVPMNMYSQYAPKSLGLPLPVPVPMFLPVTLDSAERIMETIQEIKQKIPSDPFEAELILMAEMVAEQNEKNDKEEAPKEKERDRQEAAASDDQASNFCDDLDTEELASFLNNWEDGTSEAGLRSPGRPCGLEKLHAILDIPTVATNEPYSEPLAPVATPMDVEADFAVETLERMARLREQSERSPSPPPAATRRRRQAHRKAREKRGRKAQRSLKAAEPLTQKGASNKAVTVDVPKLKSQYGVDAWKRWIQWRQTQPNLEKPRFGSRPIELKEDVLCSTTAELSYGLCCFITEVKRPNGEPYSPDSLFYLCLGIQQYLFENGRVENIFMDRFYNKFSTEFNDMLRDFKPSITASGYIHSRVEEEFLWDCKQLGAYSPIVLLNTLLFFCCKYFGFTKAEQHRQLSFAHVMRCTKTNANKTKTTFLRFYPPIPPNEPEKDLEVPVKKRKEEGKENILEMIENTENPLRCPIRLYEFYLSKCSESVKQRTNLFYLHPERCCVPNSPLWFSSTPLNDSTMEGMLVRILTVRELHLGKRKAEGTEQKTSEDAPFIPNDEDEEEDSE